MLHIKYTSKSVQLFYSTANNNQLVCFYHSLILLNRITEYIQNHYHRGDLCYNTKYSSTVV